MNNYCRTEWIEPTAIWLTKVMVGSNNSNYWTWKTCDKAKTLKTEKNHSTSETKSRTVVRLGSP